MRVFWSFTKKRKNPIQFLPPWNPLSSRNGEKASKHGIKTIPNNLNPIHLATKHAMEWNLKFQFQSIRTHKPKALKHPKYSSTFSQRNDNKFASYV